PRESSGRPLRTGSSSLASGAPSPSRAESQLLPESADREEYSLVPGPAVDADVDRSEVPLARVPAEAGDGFGTPVDDRRHDVGRGRIRRLAADLRLLLVRGREIGARVDVGVIDHRNLETVALEPPDLQQILWVDEVRRSRVARMALGILGVQLILDVPA